MSRVWKDRIVEYPRRYKDQNGNTLVLTPDSGIVIEEGTPVNAMNLNGIEQDIVEHVLDFEEFKNNIEAVRYVDEKLELKINGEWIEFTIGSPYPVGNVSGLSVVEDDMAVTIKWSDPPDLTIDDSLGNPIVIAKWKGTKILRKIGSYPQNENDGVLVVDNGVRDQYKLNGFVDTGLINDTEYFYMAFPYTEDDVFTVDVLNRVSATPTEIKIYGVEIDESNSNPETSVVYTDNAVGFTPASGNNGAFTWGSWENIIKNDFMIKPCLLNNPTGTVNYYLNYDNFTQKALGGTSNLTGADGDVMIEFGQELWWKFNRIGSKLKIQMSTKEFTGAVKHAFEIENGYNQVSIYPLFLTQIIYLLMFKNLNSQIALGRGNSDGSANYLSTGGTNAKTFNYGETTGRLQMKFLGMEDFWGNRRWWIDGCFYDANRNILIGKGNFNDTGNGYENFGITSAVDLNGYINKVQGGNNTGFIPASTGGSETTYYSDFGHLSGGRLPSFGGGSGDGGSVGGFFLFSSAASFAAAFLGGRLCYSRSGKIYIGAYLGVSQNSKLRSVSGQISHSNATIGVFRTLAKANN